MYRLPKWTFLVNAAVIGLLLNGCSTSQPNTKDATPDWVANPPKNSRYVYGVGTYQRIDNLALAFAQAEQNGNGQIAQQLRTRVSQSNMSQVEVTQTTGEAEQVVRNDRLYTRVYTAPIELEQIVNQERYIGPNYVYALQALDRSRALSRLRQQIDTLDNQIIEQGALLADTIVEPDWPIYMRLIPDFAQRTKLVEKYQLYSQNNTLYHDDARVKAIESKLSDAMNQYHFYLAPSSLRQALSVAFTDSGLSTSQAAATFSVDTDIAQRQQYQNERYYTFIDGSITLSSRNGDTIGSWQATGRGIASQPDAAEQKAKQEWAQKAVIKLLEHLSSDKY